MVRAFATSTSRKGTHVFGARRRAQMLSVSGRKPRQKLEDHSVIKNKVSPGQTHPATRARKVLFARMGQQVRLHVVLPRKLDAALWTRKLAVDGIPSGVSSSVRVRAAGPFGRAGSSRPFPSFVVVVLRVVVVFVRIVPAARRHAALTDQAMFVVIHLMYFDRVLLGCLCFKLESRIAEVWRVKSEPPWQRPTWFPLLVRPCRRAQFRPPVLFCRTRDSVSRGLPGSAGPPWLVPDSVVDDEISAGLFQL